MERTIQILSIIFFIFAGLWFVNCNGAGIDEFKLDPQNACGKSGSVNVTVYWKTHGFDSVTLSSSPKVLSDKSVATDGTTTLAIPISTLISSGKTSGGGLVCTEIKLTASKSGKQTSKKIDFCIVPPGGAYFQIEAAPDCSQGSSKPNWTDVQEPNVWGSGIEISSIKNTSDRQIHLTKDASSDDISQGGTSGQWNHQSPSGVYSFDAKLKDDSSGVHLGSGVHVYESCKDDYGPGTTSGFGTIVHQKKPPPTLRIIVSVGCP